MTATAPDSTVLLVEDDADMAANMGEYLERRGWSVHYASTGALALHLAAERDFAVIVLDRGLPLIDGLEVCRRLRAGPVGQIPILMLTAADRLEDRLDGFAAGVDDYVVKPFALPELVARLTALVRRAGGRPAGVAAGVLRCGDIELRPDLRRVTRAGRKLQLTNMGFAILELLMRRSPAVVPREEIERALWGDEPPGSDALRSHLFALGAAVDGEGGEPLLHTHRGIGYQLASQTGAGSESA